MIDGSVQMLRNSGDKALIVREAVTHDDHTLGGDFIFADVLAMVATAHLDNDHDLAKLAVDTHVPKPDNVCPGATFRLQKRHRRLTPLPVTTIFRSATGSTARQIFEWEIAPGEQN
jgi:hypothetical protein